MKSLWALLAIWSQHTNTPTLNWKDFPSLPLHVLNGGVRVSEHVLSFPTESLPQLPPSLF